MFEGTRELGADLFQICDYAPLLGTSEGELRDAATAVRGLGLTIELGTKGVAPDHLATFLRLADLFDARLVRSMVYAPDFRPTLEEAEGHLRTALRGYEAAGVTLALVERVGSDRLGARGTGTRWGTRGTGSRRAGPGPRDARRPHEPR